MSAGFGQPKDGRFNSIWIKGKEIIDGNGDLKVKNIKTKNLNITGTLSGDGWKNVDLPDSDDAMWAPANNTHYFHSNFTSMRTLTLSQASMNALYPNAEEKTMIHFDFPPSRATSDMIQLNVTDLHVFQDESDNSPPSSYSYIYYMHAGYVLKENGDWILVMPVLSWD